MTDILANCRIHWIVLASTIASCGGGNEAIPNDEPEPCASGLVREGETCVDVDECALETDNCDARASCMNNHGGFSCECPAGWMSDGTECQPAPCKYQYDTGHGDMYVSWDPATMGLTMALRSKLDPNAVGELLYPPFEVCVNVPRSTYEEVVGLGGRPPGSGWDPVGVPEAQAFWYLPEVAVDGVPWFGVASDSGMLGGVPIGVFGDYLSLSLKVDAPPDADFSAWVAVSNPEMPPFVYSTKIGLDEWDIITGSHVHLSWAFTKPGEYFVEASVTGTLVAGETKTSPPVTYRFVVKE